MILKNIKCEKELHDKVGKKLFAMKLEKGARERERERERYWFDGDRKSMDRLTTIIK